MGLLDALTSSSMDDPQSQAVMGLAMGLLSGRGSEGFAKGIQGAMQGYQNAKQAKWQDELMQFKRQEMQADINQKNLKASSLSSLDGLPLDKMSLDQATRLGAVLGKDLLPAWKLSREGIEQKAGTWNINAQTGQREYIADPTKGLGVSGGQVVGLPGYAQANAAIKGAEADAVEGAKARFDPMQVRAPDGSMQLVPRIEAVRPQQSMQQGQFPSLGGNTSAITPSMMEMIRRDAAANGISNPMVRADVQPGQRLDWTPASGQQQLQRFSVTPSDAERVAQEAAMIEARDRAGANVKRESTQKDEAKRYGQFSEASTRAIDLLNQGPTGSGFGSLLDSGAAFFGKSTKGAEVSEQLKTVAGWLVSNVPRMEGPQSNVDVMNYQVMAGNVGNEKLPVEQRLAAAKEVKRLQDKYAALNGGSAQPSQPTGKAPMLGQVMDGYKFKGGNPADPSSWEKQ